MPQLAIYLDTETARRLDEAASKDGLSRSAWVRKALVARLDSRFPESFFDVLGQWEDNREPEEILADIRSRDSDAKREKLD